MVDVDTALRSSAYSGRKRSKDDRSKDQIPKVLEPFDPVAAYEKEKADAWSMWLVIGLGVSFALFQRFVILPMMDGPARSIWLLPLSLVFLLPTIHRLVIPSRFSDLYTGGNWFRAGMLFLFTWLAASVAMINPPLGDIAAPEVPDGIGVADTADVASVEYNGGDLILSVADGSPDITIGFSVRDNWKLEDIHMNATIQRYGDDEVVLAGWMLDSESATLSNQRYMEIANWTGSAEPASKVEDMGFAFDLESLEPGIHTISIRLVEEGDLWKNQWSGEYTLNVQVQ